MRAGTKIQICNYLTARYAGMRNYGAIFGTMASMIALAGAIGPIIGGIAYGAYLKSQKPAVYAGLSDDLEKFDEELAEATAAHKE